MSNEDTNFGFDESDVLPEIPGYTPQELVATGGFAAVYRGRQHSLNRNVAIRTNRDWTLNNGGSDRLRNEASILASLQHPHVVSILDCVEHEGKVFLIHEFAKGSTLASVAGHQPQQDVLSAGLIERIARTVQHIHEKGITHCNLKPRNILFATRPAQFGNTIHEFDSFEEVYGLPVISGFGLALNDKSREKLQEGQVYGTPTYMSPEQAAGRSREVGPASDIYALGAILYFMLTTCPPFVAHGKNIRELLSNVLQAEPEPVRKVNPLVDARLEGICSKCLEKKPEDRFASATELAAELGEFIRSRSSK